MSRLAPALAAALALAAAPAPAAEPAPAPDVWPDRAATDDDAARAGRSRLPLTQRQIETLGELLRQSRRAARRAEGPRPRGAVRRVDIVSAMSGPVPVVRVRRGHVTVVSVTDASGAPWPIREAVLDERFLASGAEPSDHVLYLSPRAPLIAGNAALRLRGRPDPVILALEEGGDGFDHMVDVRLAAPGPDADPEALTRPEALSAGDDALVGVLTGNPPPGARRVAVEGGGAGDRAWRLGDDLLLVTALHLLSPGPRAAERGGGGRWAYRLPFVPLALVSRDGRIARLAFRPRAGLPEEAPEEEGAAR